MVLGKVTATGKYKLSVQSASDGSQNPVAIVVRDTQDIAATTDTKIPENATKPAEQKTLLGDYEIPGLEGAISRVRVFQQGERIEAVGLNKAAQVVVGRTDSGAGFGHAVWRPRAKRSAKPEPG